MKILEEQIVESSPKKAPLTWWHLLHWHRSRIFHIRSRKSEKKNSVDWCILSRKCNMRQSSHLKHHHWIVAPIKQRFHFATVPTLRGAETIDAAIGEPVAQDARLCGFGESEILEQFYGDITSSHRTGVRVQESQQLNTINTKCSTCELFQQRTLFH
ncbi:hypothetical protein Tcan_01359, partial [Toxocara canis]